MQPKNQFPKEVFTSLNELLEMEQLARNFSLSGKRKKVNRILGGKHTSALRGRGLDFEEVRQYVKGDDIRNIDWKVTARTRLTHTRVYSEEKEKPALIVVDQSASMFFGSQKRTKAVVAAELAALISFRVLKDGDRVGGVVFADEGIDFLMPKRDRKNMLRFLDKIVTRNHELATSHETQFERLLHETLTRIRNLITHDFFVAIISDFHRYSPEVIKFIAQLSQHNDVALFKVSDPLERDIPRMQFVAGNNDSQITVEGKDPKLRKKFAAGFDKDLVSFQDRMKKYGIPLITMDTIDPVNVQLKTKMKRM